MLIYSSLAALVFFSLGFFCLIAWINVLLAPRLNRDRSYLKQQYWSGELPTVSVLVPARNEAHQIAFCIRSLLDSDYPQIEVIVVDDQSTDGTGRVLQDLSMQHPQSHRLRVFRLEDELPLGWTGKARACHVLAQHAKGEIFIFCDADVTATRTTVSDTVASLFDYCADALTALPAQLGGSLLNQSVVAAVTQFTILISLPLFLVPRSRSSALATGNGQWFAWRREAYFACDGHVAVRTSRIEDVALGRLIKSRGYRLLVVNAGQDLVVHMYETLAAARQGFRKNLFGLAGESYLAVVVITLMLLLILSAPVWAYFWLGSIYTLLILVLQLAIILAQRHMFGTKWSVLWRLPFGLLLALGFLIESAYWTRRGQLYWKDRAV